MVRTGVTRTGILGADARGLLIGVGSAPERGKANAELIKTIARITQTRQSAVELVSGASSRHKSVRIRCAAPTDLAVRLAALVTQKLTSDMS
jgi:uncharacterized protein